MSRIPSLEALLIDELKDLHSAETQLVKALPKMAEAATDTGLRQAFASHLTETRGHVERLEQALKLLEVKGGSKTCHAMKGLVQEGSEAIEAGGPDAVRDANLIGAAQRVEHYEMAAYGCARAFAEKLERPDIAQLLQQTLDEEKKAESLLGTLGTSKVNQEALAA